MKKNTNYPEHPVQQLGYYIIIWRDGEQNPQQAGCPGHNHLARLLYLIQRLEQTDVSVSWRRVLRGSRGPPGARHHGAREVTTNKLELTRFFFRCAAS